MTDGGQFGEVAAHPDVPVEQVPLRLEGDARRSILLPFNMGGQHGVDTVVAFVKGLSDDDVRSILSRLKAGFQGRHPDLDEQLDARCQSAAVFRSADGLSRDRRLLVGAYLTMEYSIEAAALFNPSIVAAPDQRGSPPGTLRFIMSLRAVGEGHISATVFQTGALGPGSAFQLDPISGRSANPHIEPDIEYHKDLLWRKVRDLGPPESFDELFDRLPDRFTHADLDAVTRTLRQERGDGHRLANAIATLEWLVRANYRLRLLPSDAIGDVVLFPRSDSESKGIEDMRLVRFRETDGSASYFGTYTGFNGQAILPMLMETPDFRSFAVHTLNGACVQNKGMALFPRRIGGHYAMCSRIDGRSLYLMYSDYVHFWEEAQLLAEPKRPWELRLIGNCGSPLETREGWLLITHGVGAMRTYSIGAMLLDLDDPARVRGRLKAPLLSPSAQGRRGYVPNVVYSCGSLLHQGKVFLPYAVSDSSTRVAVIPEDALVDRLIADGP